MAGRDKSPTSAIGAHPADRYYLHHPGHHPAAGQGLALDAVRAWREQQATGLPLSSLIVGEPSIRHVDSVQHQSLLMSHPALGVGSSPSPSSASSSVAAVSPPSAAAAAAAAASTPSSGHYPPPPSVVVPAMIAQQQPLQHQLPAHLYTPMQEMLWKAPRFAGGLAAGHMHTAFQDELDRERDRAYAHDRDRQERQDRQLR